jgi:hypothetical protein
MKSNTLLRNMGLFIFLVVIDITLIQLFRHFTPFIIPLRLGFVFLVIAGSILVYYIIIKPSKPIKTGAILSIISFLFALCESYIFHVVIEHNQYQLLYLLPSSFALILPFLLSVVYRKFIVGRSNK